MKQLSKIYLFLMRKFLIGPTVVFLVFFLSFTTQKLRLFLLVKNNPVVSYGFTLIESSDITNFHFRHNNAIPAKRFKNIQPYIAAGGASVAIADINNDGFQDIFLNDSSEKNEHALFINQKNGRFSNQLQNFRLDNIKTPNSEVTRAMFFDCNNDNYPELFLFSNPPKLFENINGKYFKDISAHSGLQIKTFQGYASNVFDFDNDGNLDIIWGSYFSNDIFSEDGDTSGILPYNFIASSNKASLHLFRGNGKCQFTDTTKKIQTDKTRGWFFSIGIQDIFQRGKQDIFIASDYGIDHLFVEDDKDKKWNDKSFMIDHPSLSKNGMGIVFSDVSHTNNPFGYTSNIFRTNEQVAGNLLWKFDKKSNTFSSIGNKYNVTNCGWSWGAQFIDLNMDSWDDLVVVNGFVGNSSQKSYWYNLSVLDATNRQLMADHRNWPDMTNFQLDGAQRDCIFINQGKKNSFEEATSSTKFDIDTKNGRGLAYIDINNDGKYSLVVANQDDIAHIYQVKSTIPHDWIGISLVGRKSNIPAWGAKIYWTLSDGSQSYKEMRPINGFASQSDPRFLLGIPKPLSIKELYIIWPTQKKQFLKLENIHLNKYQTIQEEL